jgi:hypothetical protein
VSSYCGDAVVRCWNVCGWWWDVKMLVTFFLMGGVKLVVKYCCGSDISCCVNIICCCFGVISNYMLFI